MTYYDAIAAGYEGLHKEEQLKKIALIKEKIPFDKKWKMLDVGCGPYFADFPGFVVGIDPAFKLLQIAKKKIPVVYGEGEFLPFRNDSFIVVVSITALQNFDDIENGLQEMKRVAKEHIVVSVLKRSVKMKIIEQCIARIFPRFNVIEEEKDMIFFCRKKF